MAANGEVLGELIKAEENIKRKYTALKQGKVDIHSLVSETLNNSIEDSFKINDWFKSYDIDKTYGSKIRANGSVHLGKKEINLVDNTLTIEDISYPLTQGLGMTPVQADSNPTSVEIKQRKIINRKNKFNIDYNVRISTYKGVFAKGYLASWSTEIFKIVKINETLPTIYQLQDYTGKPIAGCFYSEEILKTNYPNDYLVENIIRKKGNQFFVKWLRFDNTHNSWINIRDIRNSVSRATDMNVFGSSQCSETKKNISNLEQSMKSFSSKLDKIEHLFEENHKPMLIQEEQTETGEEAKYRYNISKKL
ncbi:hypothetical protein QTP88_029023 [Uroleucon formosanum]